jgi:hypothetical protein
LAELLERAVAALVWGAVAELVKGAAGEFVGWLVAATARDGRGDNVFDEEEIGAAGPGAGGEGPGGGAGVGDGLFCGGPGAGGEGPGGGAGVGDGLCWGGPLGWDFGEEPPEPKFQEPEITPSDSGAKYENNP